MTFSSGERLDAADLNDLKITTLCLGTDTSETPLTVVTTNKLGGSFTGTIDGEGLRVDQSNYTADNYVSMVEASYDDGQAEPHVRIGAQFTGSGSKLAFGTSNSYGSGITNEALVIDQTGKVGIGTTSPTQTLDVRGIARVGDDTNRTPGASGEGHLMIDGLGYTGYVSLDGAAMWVGNTSASRKLYLATDETARLTVAGNGTVGIGTTTPDHMLEILSSGGTSNLRCHNDSGSEGFRVAATIVRSASIVGLTTGTAANVFINSANNTLYRSTSSIKYKTDVETMADEYADAILELRPVWYRSLGPTDPDSWGYWGFIAEEVAEIDPRLVSFGTPTDYERQYGPDGPNGEQGEPLEPELADLTEPEGVQYDRIVPHLVNLIKRQNERLQALEQRVATLEAG